MGTPIANAYGPRLLPLAYHRRSAFYDRTNALDTSVANNGSPLVLRGKREIDFTPLIYARRSSEKYEAFVKDGPFHFNPLQSGDSSHKYPGSRASVKRLGSTFVRSIHWRI
uniref:Uncharacterized protein n=1 Tax=Vespula pensylvanica TaxID=30213 RepID=A0A834P5L2_VESPE|nr:hypothetical protein H0235_005918 [Vespula pensylvanica]